jgi:hypothetical protein
MVALSEIGGGRYPDSGDLGQPDLLVTVDFNSMPGCKPDLDDNRRQAGRPLW